MYSPIRPHRIATPRDALFCERTLLPACRPDDNRAPAHDFLVLNYRPDLTEASTDDDQTTYTIDLP